MNDVRRHTTLTCGVFIMALAAHEISFNGSILQRGFWLYVWEVKSKKGDLWYYVGRTGDNSSHNAQSPFNRMGQHLGFAENSSMLRRHLAKKKVDPVRCSFRLIAVGPIYPEEMKIDGHWKRRDLVAAMEKALADEMTKAGYQVMNSVKSRIRLDARRYAKVRRVFRSKLSKLPEKRDK
ncbi:hypothetical protein [Dongia sp.]|uniref:hypothetical protein n=1 Tax=Dongia sp. TaxID=1977262 RepID=UPI0034A13003